MVPWTKDSPLVEPDNSGAVSGSHRNAGGLSGVTADAWTQHVLVRMYFRRCKRMLESTRPDQGWRAEGSRKGESKEFAAKMDLRGVPSGKRRNGGAGLTRFKFEVSGADVTQTARR